MEYQVKYYSLSRPISRFNTKLKTLINRTKDIPGLFAQFAKVLPLHVKANDFIKTNKLWKGLFKMKWVFWTAIIFSIIFSFHFISVFFEWIRVILMGQQQEESAFLASNNMFNSIQLFGNEVFVSGGVKYLIFIFAEVIIFHCTVTTINILSGKKQRPKFKDFINAEKRMIVVSLTAWIMEIIVSFAIGLILSILGLNMIKKFSEFIIQFYFIGHLFLDNYNEQFGLTVKESFRHIRTHAGAAIAIGAVAYFLFLIPIVGMIVAPILGAVTGALYMFTHSVHDEKERIYEFV